MRAYTPITLIVAVLLTFALHIAGVMFLWYSLRSIVPTWDIAEPTVTVAWLVVVGIRLVGLKVRYGAQ